MSDQANETWTSLFSFLNDEDVEASYSQLIEAIDKISLPSTDLITPTLNNTTNTRLLTLLCQKLISMDTILADHAVSQTIRGLAEIQKHNEIRNRALSQGENRKESVELEALYHITEATHAKNRLWVQYANLVNAAKDEADTILKVAKTLLEVQETCGKEVRKDVRALGKLTVSIKVIDSRWPLLKQNYIEMQTAIAEIEKLEKIRAVLQFEVIGEDGRRSVVNADVSELPEDFMFEDQDRGQGAEGSEDEKMEIDLDAESSEEEILDRDDATSEGFPIEATFTKPEIGQSGEDDQIANVAQEITKGVEGVRL